MSQQDIWKLLDRNTLYNLWKLFVLRIFSWSYNWLLKIVIIIIIIYLFIYSKLYNWARIISIIWEYLKLEKCAWIISIR